MRLDGHQKNGTYSATDGTYTGSVVTPLEGIGNISGEWLELVSDVSHNINTYRLYALEEAGDVGAHLLPKSFYIAGKQNNSDIWYPVQKVQHLSPSAASLIEASTNEYSLTSDDLLESRVINVGGAYNMTEYSND